MLWLKKYFFTFIFFPLISRIFILILIFSFKNQFKHYLKLNFKKVFFLKILLSYIYIIF